MRRLDVRRTFQPVHWALRKFKRFEADVQEIREKLIKKLLEAIEAAHQRALDPSVSEKDKMKAAGVCAYLAQRINGILRDYDMLEMEKDIEELEKRVAKIMEERERPGRKGRVKAR